MMRGRHRQGLQAIAALAFVAANFVSLVGCTAGAPQPLSDECVKASSDLTSSYVRLLETMIFELRATPRESDRYEKRRLDAVAMQRSMRSRVEANPTCFSAKERRLVRDAIPGG